MLPNLILLVFDEADLASLNAAVSEIKLMGVENLWVLHNPQLGLPYPPEAQELTRQITENQEAERKAAARQDYTSASGYRDAANGLIVERATVIKNAYKTLKPEELQAAYTKALAAISAESTGAANILVEAIPDPLTRSQAFSFLASQRAANWVDQFPEGEYAVVWVQALRKKVAGATTKPEPKAVYTEPHTEESLNAITSFPELRKIASDLQIPKVFQMTKKELIPAILSKQSLVVEQY